MLRILLVKTSSLGDVVHNFPVASDVRKHFPDACIDWVVEEPYVSMVRLHPDVRRVIPVALRRWRHNLLGPDTWKGIGEFRRMSRIERYDAIIDTQGLLKSALIARTARGRHHGFDASSAREGLAARLYDATHHVRRAQHAVVRNRQLAAASLGYRVEEPIRYGLKVAAAAGDGPPYCVLLHGTSRADKLWPVEAWAALGRRLEERGLMCVLPWGDTAERGRSERIAAELQQATIPPLMSLEKMARLLSGAAAVIGVDTGLVHLSAALARPTVAVFAGSNPELTGVYGAPLSRNLGRQGTPPGVDEILNALRDMNVL